jgi:uncharacterized protein YndB with AHSA1/START domain
MQRINFSISINTPKEKVWQVLWDDSSYRQWTSAFCEGSYAVTDNWKEGTKVLFLSPGGSGMVSTVAVNRANEYMSFKHMGEVKDGVEDTTSERVKVWAGSLENYTLAETGGVTELGIEIDITEEFKDMFMDMWPKALKLVKDLSENKS